MTLSPRRFSPRFSAVLATLLSGALLLGCAIHVDNRKSVERPPSSEKPDARPDDEKPSKPKPKPEKPKPEKPKPKPEKPKPTEPKPKPTEPTEPKPPVVEPLPPESARIVVPIRVPFDQAVASLDELLPKHEKEGWKRVTKSGKSPEVEAKYEVWRDPVEASFRDGKLRVVIPLRYAANVRVRAKNPLDGKWFWLTRDETWGTKADPQRMKITAEFSLSVDGSWKLVTARKIESIQHGAPPSGKFCGQVGIQICTDKDSLAPEVRERIEARVVPRIEEGLSRASREIEKRLALEERAASLWSALQTPLSLQKESQKDCPTEVGACRRAVWLVVTPEKLGMSDLGLEKGEFGVDLSLEGKITTKVGKKPTVKAVPLPARSKPTGPTEIRLRTRLELPLAELESAFGRELDSSRWAVGDRALDVEKIALSVEDKGVLRLAVTTSGLHGGTLVARGRVRYDAKKKSIGLEALEFDAATKALFEKELKGLDPAVLEKALLDKAVWKLGSAADRLPSAVTQALDKALPGRLDVSGELSELEVLDVKIEEKIVSLFLDLRGTLGVKFTPR